MGLDYRFVADGNDTEALLAVLNEVKDIDHPVVVHIVTQKGKGYKIAEENKEDWHWHMPFDIETGEVKQPLADPYAEQTAETNPLFISGQDKDLLAKLKADHELVVTLEDGVLDGGFGEKIARFYGADKMKVLNFGLTKKFYDRYDYEALAKENHLTAAQVAADILANL